MHIAQRQFYDHVIQYDHKQIFARAALQHEKGKKNMSNELVLRPSHWACISGGKDSALMMKIIFDNPDEYPLNGVIHYELEIDYPFIKDVVNYIKGMCEQRGIKFVSIKPRKSWYDLYKEKGFPTRRVRWCNGHYKMDSVKQLKEYLKSIGFYAIFYIGYCKDEVKRYETRSGRKEIYPLVDFGIDEDKCLEWAKTQSIFNNYYLTQRRCGCMFCPLASRLNLAYLLKYYPEKFNELMALTRKTEIMRSKELGRPFSVWTGEPKYNTDYIEQNVRTKWLPKLEEMEREAKNGDQNS